MAGSGARPIVLIETILLKYEANHNHTHLSTKREESVLLPASQYKNKLNARAASIAKLCNLGIIGHTKIKLSLKISIIAYCKVSMVTDWYSIQGNNNDCIYHAELHALSLKNVIKKHTPLSESLSLSLYHKLNLTTVYPSPVYPRVTRL